MTMVTNKRLVEIFTSDPVTDDADFAEKMYMAKDLWSARRMLAALKEAGVEFPHLPQIHPQRGDVYEIAQAERVIREIESPGSGCWQQ